MAEMLSPSYLPYITQTPAPAAAAAARGRKWLLCPLQIDPGYRLELHTNLHEVFTFTEKGHTKAVFRSKVVSNLRI